MVQMRTTRSKFCEMQAALVWRLLSLPLPAAFRRMHELPEHTVSLIPASCQYVSEPAQLPHVQRCITVSMSSSAANSTSSANVKKM